MPAGEERLRPPAPKARWDEVVTCEDRELRKSRPPWALSVVARSGPASTSVNGAVVTRPMTDDPYKAVVQSAPPQP